MDLLKFDHLESLEKSRSDWKIKVRVTRIWPTTSQDGGSMKGFNVILLDDDNTHVHAFAYADVWGVIGKNIVEGGVYTVENFAVRDAVGNLKPVSHEICLRLNNGTTFVSVQDDFMIPRHKFEFLDLGDLLKEASRYETTENPEYAIDVIGVVKEYEKLQKIKTKFGERDIVRFKLCDTSFRHRVAVWGELAKSVHNEYSTHLDKNVIAILTSTKLTIYKNSVQISTLPSSKVYFNLDDESVVEMKHRLQEEGYKSSQYVDDTSYELTVVLAFEKKTLRELNENPSQNLKKKIFSTFKIGMVEEINNWWSYACNKCHNEVFNIQRKFKCDNCTRTSPTAEKRFRIKVIGEETGFSSSVFLLDRVVKSIIGISAANMYQNELKDPEYVPNVLNTLVGKEVTVAIDLMEPKIQEEGFAYHAIDMYDSSSVITSISESSPPPEFPIINLSDTFSDSEVTKTPGSAISVNKKIKMEK